MIIIESYILLFILFFLFKKFFKKLVSKHYSEHQKLAGKDTVPLIGGIIFISFIIINYQKLENLVILFSFLICFLGIMSDTNFLQSPKKRLFFQIFIIFVFLHFANLNLEDLRSEFLNHIISNNFSKHLFLTFCFVILINGSNFIDGLNGLNLGYFLLIFLALLLLNFKGDIYIEQNKVLLLIIPIIFLLIMNFFNYLYLGDSGAYLIGFLSGILLVEINYLNLQISPYFIALLLWYPAFENFFSIIRKMLKKYNPVLPDTSHLHQLIFKHVKSRKFQLNIYANQISTIIILSFNFVIFLLSLNYIHNTKFLLLLIIINILVYLSVYLLLEKKYEK